MKLCDILVFLLEYVLHAYYMWTDNNITSVKVHNQMANLNRMSSSKTKTIQIYNNSQCFEINWLKNVYAAIESITQNDVVFELNLFSTEYL